MAVGALFRPLGFHETQLWINPEWLDDRIVGEALDVIQDRPYRLRLLDIGGYDLSGFGSRVA